MITFYHIIGPFNICLSNLLHLKWNVQTVGSIPLAGHGKLPPTLQSGPGQRRWGRVGRLHCLVPLCITPLGLSKRPLRKQQQHSLLSPYMARHPSIAHGWPENQVDGKGHGPIPRTEVISASTSATFEIWSKRFSLIEPLNSFLSVKME